MNNVLVSIKNVLNPPFCVLEIEDNLIECMCVLDVPATNNYTQTDYKKQKNTPVSIYPKEQAQMNIISVEVELGYVRENVKKNISASNTS